MTIYEKEHKTQHFYKVWFTDGKERTAKIIVDTLHYPLRITSVEEYSRLFPYSECRADEKTVHWTALSHVERSVRKGLG